MKGKGERARYTQLKVEFQGIAKRNKAFFNKQCKEIEGNNKMGKARHLFNKIGDIKGVFHARMGMIKDRNGKDLTKAEEIKKRWQEYKELYKKDLNDSDNHDDVATHLESDILECEVKWSLGRITTKTIYKWLDSITDSMGRNLSKLQHQCSLPVSWLFTPSGQGIGASASASVLPMNIQD